MSTAILGVAKSMVSGFENLIETKVVRRIYEVAEFVLLLTFPLLMPIGIMYFSQFQCDECLWMLKNVTGTDKQN